MIDLKRLYQVYKDEVKDYTEAIEAEAFKLKVKGVKECYAFKLREKIVFYLRGQKGKDFITIIYNNDKVILLKENTKITYSQLVKVNNRQKYHWLDVCLYLENRELLNNTVISDCYASIQFNGKVYDKEINDFLTLISYK